ncbi:multidrug effflux MFS transporter [Albimonas pacifica]|uniref:Bcr/CflA family efflux transporter n=1 Tax=Albimonas pacifica TaxID=1114924 RepID=A0A1I3MII9_9RHOB|nr:multidrug effflux MFS transporter [Albimonas pacifica]SFI96752.1 MFS transporter, DHA1 family, bicyclomycin/chloramphenicol resistance protein [Albimonas pacifica]
MRFPAAATPPHIVTLILLTAGTTVTLNMFLPSLAHIAERFGVSYGAAGWLVSGYLGVTALLQLLIGPLSDRFGRRPVLLTCLCVFLVASVGCFTAQSFETLLAFRLLQGAMIAGSALSPAIVRDLLPPEQAASRIGYIATAMAVGPILGPSIGGLLDEGFGWRASFAVYALIAAGLIGLVWRDLGETNTTRSADFGKQFREYPELLRSRRFWGCALCMAFSVGGFFAFIAGAPLIAREALGLSPAELGIALGSITTGFASGAFLSGRYAGRVGLTGMMMLGRCTACAGIAAGLGLALAGHVSVISVFGATIFVGVGNGLTMPSANAGAVSVRPRLAGSAAGLAGALNVGGGAAITAGVTAAISRDPRVSVLLGLMLALCLAGLAAAFYVRWVDRREAATGGRALGMDGRPG